LLFALWRLDTADGAPPDATTTRERNGMGNDKRWLVPLTGVAFVVLLIIGFAIGGEPPDATKDTPQEIVDFYVDNKDTLIIGLILEGIAGTLFVFFGGYLRRVLRDSEGEGGMLSAIAFAGTVIFAMGLAIDSTITFTLVENADEIEPSGVQALTALYNYDFVPFAMGIQIFLLATGILVVSRGALPKWIGWIAILIAVIAMTPLGFGAFIATGLLVAVISVMLALRERGAGASQPGVPPTGGTAV